MELIEKLHRSFKAEGKRIFLFLLLASYAVIVPHSCIVPYEAQVDEDVAMISIEGSLIKGQETQTVYITKTAPLLDIRLNPVRECMVSIADDRGNEFYFTESKPGEYTAAIPDDDLIAGRDYRLHVVTPNGESYASEYETLNQAAPVDTLYYEITDLIDKISGDELQGLQFYVDLKASDSISRYFRWKLNETFEYTSIVPVTYYFDASDSLIYLDNIYEFFRCWKTQKLNRLFLSSTENLTLNEKKKIPLNFVSTKTDRLKYKYSLLVEQYTMGEGAYNYWLKKKVETQESGGLYTQQPGKPVTNLYKVGDEDEMVLGYFWASHKTEQRIFVSRIPSLPVPGDYCEAVEFDPIVHEKNRYFYVDDISGQILTGADFCFNCLLKGGSTTPPDFWE